MTAYRSLLAVFTCLLLVLLLSGCALTKRGTEVKAPDTAPPPPPPAAVQAEPEPKASIVPIQPPTPQPQQKPKVTGQAAAPHKPATPVPPEPSKTGSSPRRHLETGEYQKVLDEYNAAHVKRPRDRILTAEYAKSVEEIKAAADKAFLEDEFTSAGRIYDLLLKRYAKFKAFAHLLKFNRTHLTQKLSLCKKSLSVQGFKEYRKGNLDEAVALWQGLLSLDPGNQDIRKAMLTAADQQRNLQKR